MAPRPSGVADQRGGDAPPREGGPRVASAWPSPASLLATVLVRLPFLGTPLSVDEGGYAAVARFWARGFHLYGTSGSTGRRACSFSSGGRRPCSGRTGRRPAARDASGRPGLVSLLSLLVARLSAPRLGLLAGADLRRALGRAADRGLRRQRRAAGAVPSVAALLLFAVLAGRPRADLGVAGRRRRAAPGCAVLVKQSGYDGGGAIALWLALAAWRGWRPRRRGAAGARAAGRGRRAAGGGLAALHGALTGCHDWWFAVAGYRLSVESVATGSASDRLQLLRGLAHLAWPCRCRCLLVPGACARLRRSGPRPACWRLGRLALTGFALGGLFHPHYYVGLVAPASRWRRSGSRAPGALAAAAAARIVVAALFVPVASRRLPPRRRPAPTPTPRGAPRTTRACSRTRDVRRLAARRTAPDDRSTPCTPTPACTSTPTGGRRTATSGPSACSTSRARCGELRSVLAGPRAPRYIVHYQGPGTIDRQGVSAGSSTAATGSDGDRRPARVPPRALTRATLRAWPCATPLADDPRRRRRAARGARRLAAGAPLRRRRGGVGAARERRPRRPPRARLRARARAGRGEAAAGPRDERRRRARTARGPDALVLTPKGRLVADLRLARPRDDAFLLECEPRRTTLLPACAATGWPRG